MSTINDEVKVEGVYGGVQANGTTSSVNTDGNPTGSWTTENSSSTVASSTSSTTTTTSSSTNLPVTRSFWSNMKAFWLQEIDLKQKIDWKREIKVELTPYQQKIEDEINEFLHQDITWEKFRNFITKPFSSKAKSNS